MYNPSSKIVFRVSNTSEVPTEKQWVFHHCSNELVKVPSPWKRGRPVGARTQVTPTSRRSVGREPTGDFEFVGTSPQSRNVDKPSQTRIRRHVMLNEVRKKAHARSNNDSECKQKQKTVQNLEKLFSTILFKPSRAPTPAADPFNQSLVKLEPYMLDLLNYYVVTVSKAFFSLEALVGINPIKEYWIPMAFHDAALIHMFVGCAAAHAWGYKTIRPQGLEHLQATISIVSQRLADHRTGLSIGTLAIIAGMAIFETGAGRHDQWQIHMQGLNRILDPEGGIDALASEPMVLDKIYRADLYGSLEANHSPYIDRHLVSSVDSSCARPFRNDGFTAVQRAVKLGRSLCYAICQLESAMQFWLDAGTSMSIEDQSTLKHFMSASPSICAPTDVVLTRHLLYKAQYALFSANSSTRCEPVGFEDQVNELCRISLILYTTSLLEERPPSTAAGLWIGETVEYLLRSLGYRSQDGTRDTLASSTEAQDLPVDLLLWSIFLTVTTTLGVKTSTREWLLDSFKEVLLSQGAALGDEQHMKVRLGQFLWVPSIHDAKFRDFWSQTSA